MQLLTQPSLKDFQGELKPNTSRNISLFPSGDFFTWTRFRSHAVTSRQIEANLPKPLPKLQQHTRVQNLVTPGPGDLFMPDVGTMHYALAPAMANLWPERCFLGALSTVHPGLHACVASWLLHVCWPAVAHLPPRSLFPACPETGDQLWPRQTSGLQPYLLQGDVHPSLSERAPCPVYPSLGTLPQS